MQLNLWQIPVLAAVGGGGTHMLRLIPLLIVTGYKGTFWESWPS